MKIKSSDIVPVRRQEDFTCRGCIFYQKKVKTCETENKDTYQSLGRSCKSNKLFHKDRMVAKYNLAIGDYFLYDGEVRRLEVSIRKCTNIDWDSALMMRITPESLKLIYYEKSGFRTYKRVGYAPVIIEKFGKYTFKADGLEFSVLYVHEIQNLLRKYGSKERNRKKGQ